VSSLVPWLLNWFASKYSRQAVTLPSLIYVRQLERLVRELEDVHPVGHDDRSIGCDVDDAELDALDTSRASANERRNVVRDGLPCR
jgi:hypothetical protein